MNRLLMIIFLTVLLTSTAHSLSIMQLSHNVNDIDCSKFEGDERVYCEQTKSFIMQCYSNPNSCDCSSFDNGEAVAECNKWVNDGVRLMNEKVKECMNDITACDCSTLPHDKLISVCNKEKSRVNGLIMALERKCFSNPDSCDCSLLKNDEYIKKCEEEVRNARQIKSECINDITNCNCELISNDLARAECVKNKEFYIDYVTNFKSKCEVNLSDCDCSKIPELTAQVKCQQEKERAILEAKSSIYSALYNCFKDVKNCDCSKLPNEAYVAYCEETRDYGLACMETGSLGCERLDSIRLYPPGLPVFLRPYFSSTMKYFIDAEKVKWMSKAVDNAKNCVIDPENCSCDDVPVYSRGFCLEKKELQTDCIINRNITACEVLDESVEVVPRTAPKFVRDFFNPILRPLVLLQKERVKGRYAQEVKDLMIDCIRDTVNCDCSGVPAMYRDFCDNKVNLVKRCKSKDYDSCFKLMDEPNIPSDLPGFIKVFVEPSINREVEVKMNEVFNDVRPSVCDGMSVRECRAFYDASCDGLSVNDCLSDKT